MPEPKVLKGVYKEGPAVASVIIEADGRARILVKGIEPKIPRDPAFAQGLRRVIDAVRDHLVECTDIELCAVMTQSPGMAEHAMLTAEELRSLGVARLTAMDGDCGLIVRTSDTDPPPVALAYASLRAGRGIPEQPGLVEVPPAHPRKTYKALSAPQQQMYGALVQMTGRSLLKLVVFEDEGLKAAVGLRDLPPARARSVLVPFGDLATEVAGGAKLEDVAGKLTVLKGA